MWLNVIPLSAALVFLALELATLSALLVGKDTGTMNPVPPAVGMGCLRAVP